MKRKKKEREIRFRVSDAERTRIEWLVKNDPILHYATRSISALLRSLVSYEYERLKSLED